MLEIIKQKIAVKLALVITSVVGIAIVLLFLFLNNINMDKMYEALEHSVNNTSSLLEMAYKAPLWGYSYEDLDKLNEGLLNTPEFIAINVYNIDSFISGYTKKYEESGFVLEMRSKPFIIPEDETWLHKKTGEILYRDKKIGNFELFYTEMLILEADRSSRIRMSISLIILAFMIILIIYFVMKILVITPVTNLSDKIQQITANRDYSLKIQKNGDDEITSLYSGFNIMLQQVRKNEVEREEILISLKKSDENYSYIFEKLKNAVDSGEYSRVKEFNSGSKELMNSLNTFLETLEQSKAEAEKRDWLKTGLASLSNVIRGERRLKELCQNAINHIAEYLNAQVGVLFVKDDKNNDFCFTSGYAFMEKIGFNDRFRQGEGLMGQSAVEKKRILFTDVPSDYIRIESSLGSSVPKNILVFPLIYEEDVKGVVELGSTMEFSPVMIEFVDLTGSIIAVAINAALSSERLEKLLKRTNEQAEELQVQQDELKKTNVELEEQAEILKESKARLQLQQEELQTSNEEMEEKNELLENQKVEIVEKAKQLELATKYKSEFLANMSHELRTPLNSILLLARMLSDNDDDNLSMEQIESAASIHRSGQILLHLINDILDLSKIEARKIELSISKVNIRTLISNFETECKPMAGEKGLNFETSLEKGLPDTITTDIHRLEQVVRNLLSNAFKFTGKGSVSVRISRPKQEIRFVRKDLNPADVIAISVADTGPGIDPEKMQVIFEAFRQVDGSISRRHGGTGLGLSISRELSSLLGGELKGESTLGKGAVFTLYIPIELNISPISMVTTPLIKNLPEIKISGKKIEITDRDNTETAEVRTSVPGDKKILIIEDDSEFATIIANFFQKRGYKGIIAPDGETGIKYVTENKPTAIVLDIGLPGIDGWAVLNELKNNPETRHIPVHIMSAYDNTKEGLLKGAVGYLTKPVCTENLNNALDKIESVLTSRVKELLIVEDNKELQKSILKLLGTKDIHPIAVGTGEEALALLREKRFDCMILDLGLPDIPGFELLDRIDQEAQIEKTPIIIYTGRELTFEETRKLEQYSSSIVLKSAESFDRLLDETALFMHRVESDMPETHQNMIRKIHDRESVLLGKKVLIVDDDMRNAFALKIFLKNKGMDINIADNGRKAIEFLEQLPPPDIILMDIMMPVMDGYETMTRIRKINKFKNLPILALTAKAMETDREKCIKYGASDYLSKPIDTAKLLSILRVWLYGQ